MIQTNTAHAKIILMGEHSVVYGYPAIAIPFFQGKIETNIFNQQEELLISSELYEGALNQAPFFMDHLVELIKMLLSHFDYHQQDLRLSITSNFPAQRGFGSSASVATSITRAMYHYFDQVLSQEDLIEWVDFSEDIAHGNPSGIDARIATSNQPLYYVKNKPFKSFNIAGDAYLVVADSGILGQTRKAVSHLGSLVQTDKNKYETLIADLGQAAQLSYEALIKQDFKTLGTLMNKAHLLLRACEVSHPKLDQLVAIANEAGALGAKLTGGGMGGCVIALAANKQEAHLVQEALLSHADSTWITQLTNDHI